MVLYMAASKQDMFAFTELSESLGIDYHLIGKIQRALKRLHYTKGKIAIEPLVSLDEEIGDKALSRNVIIHCLRFFQKLVLDYQRQDYTPASNDYVCLRALISKHSQDKVTKAMSKYMTSKGASEVSLSDFYNKQDQYFRG